MPKTVLMLHGSAAGYGADRQLIALVAGLDRRRYRPIVVLPERGRLGDRLDQEGVETHYLELATLRRHLLSGRDAAVTGARLARDRVKLARLARSRRVDLIHTNMSTVLGGYGAASASGVPHVLHVREIFHDGRRAVRAMWPVLRRRLLRADALICVSAAAASRFDGSPRVRVVHDGLLPRPRPTQRLAARRALGLADDAAVIATVGRVSDWKGQHILAEALAREPLASMGAIGLVAGDAAPGQRRFEERLVELRRRLRLGDRLRLLGFRDDVETVHGAANVFAAPSTYPEALPNATLEAAAAGVPVVGSIDGGGLAEILHDGVTGRLVPAGDPGALAIALAELIRDPARAEALGAAAAEDVGTRFRAERMLAQVQACYDEVT